MGLLTTLGIIAASAVASKSAAKSAAEQRQAEERRLEMERAKKIAEQQEMTRRSLAIEAEKTRRTVAMQEAAKQKMILQHEAEKQRQIAIQQAVERRRKEIASIRQMRIDHPIDYTCPRCNALRIVDRRAGRITCEYCDYVQPLESFHNFVPELDSPPAPRPVPNNNNTKNNKKIFSIQKTNKSINIWALLSIIFGGISIITCGMFFIPEALSIAFGIIPLCQSREKRDGLDLGLAVTGLACGIVSLVLIFVILVTPSSNDRNRSSIAETTTSSITQTLTPTSETTAV